MSIHIASDMHTRPAVAVQRRTEQRAVKLMTQHPHPVLKDISLKAPLLKAFLLEARGAALHAAVGERP